jgi:hypothetical protein
MERYANLGGNSSVIGYRIGIGWIDVQFQDRHIYRYTNASADPSNIVTMHGLALAGRGLCSFIQKHVKHRYASKS